MIATVVFFQLLSLLMDAVAFYLLPNGISTVLQGKRSERISKRQTFAQLGLRAAIAVDWYYKLDKSQNGMITVADIVSVFARARAAPCRSSVPSLAPSSVPSFAPLQRTPLRRNTDAQSLRRAPPALCPHRRPVLRQVPGLDQEKALMLARTILRKSKKSDRLLDFKEFMDILEGGDSLNFQHFLDVVHTTGKIDKLDVEDVAEAQAAFRRSAEEGSAEAPRRSASGVSQAADAALVQARPATGSAEEARARPPPSR